MMTLNDVDLKTINTYLEHPTYNNFLSTLVVLDRVFSAKTYKLGSSKLQDDGVPGSTLMESKERWVQIIFNIIMSCMNKEVRHISLKRKAINQHEMLVVLISMCKNCALDYLFIYIR